MAGTSHKYFLKISIQIIFFCLRWKLAVKNLVLIGVVTVEEREIFSASRVLKFSFSSFDFGLS
jgi:hypothetical protein